MELDKTAPDLLNGSEPLTLGGKPARFTVLEAYGFPKDAIESDIVARLFKMYQELTSK